MQNKTQEINHHTILESIQVLESLMSKEGPDALEKIGHLNNIKLQVQSAGDLNDMTISQLESYKKRIEEEIKRKKTKKTID